MSHGFLLRTRFKPQRLPFHGLSPREKASRQGVCMEFKALQGLSDDDLKLLQIEVKKLLTYRKIKKKSNKIQKQKLMHGSDRENYIQDINKTIIEYNSSHFLIPPCVHSKRKIHAGFPYLPALLKQDWSHLFNSSSYSTEPVFYVYAHINPDTPQITTSNDSGGVYSGMPFYIGKGTGDRAYDLKRNQGHGKILNKLLARGYTKDDLVKIIFNDLTEAKAFEIESKLIYFFGTVYGHEKGVLYNLDTPSTPKFIGNMKQMMLNIQTTQNKAESCNEAI